MEENSIHYSFASLVTSPRTMRPSIERTPSREGIAALLGEQQRISREVSNLMKYCVVSKQRDVNCYSREVQESLHRFSRSKCNDPLCQKCAFRSRSGGQRRMCKYCTVRVAMPRRDYCCETSPWPLISNARTGEKAKEISKFKIPIFPNFLGLVLGCIEAKFCK